MDEQKTAADTIRKIKLTATRLATFERRLGTPLTKLTADALGFNAMVLLLQCAGMSDKEIDDACEELGLDKFVDACMGALLNSGLFSKAKLPATAKPASDQQAK